MIKKIDAQRTKQDENTNMSYVIKIWLILRSFKKIQQITDSSVFISTPPSWKQDTRKDETKMFIFKWAFWKKCLWSKWSWVWESQNPANECNSTICIYMQGCVAPKRLCLYSKKVFVIFSWELESEGGLLPEVRLGSSVYLIILNSKIENA